MKRSLIAVIAALALAGCADLPLAPDGPAADGAVATFDAEHGTIAAPVITSPADGATFGIGDVITVDFTWTGARDWELVSFELVVDDATVDDDIPNAKPYALAGHGTLVRSGSFTPTAAGTYEVCVEVMAKDLIQGPGREQTHHNRTCVSVDVVEEQIVFTVDAVKVKNGALRFDSFNAWFRLYRNGEQVMCDAPGDVSDLSVELTGDTKGAVGVAALKCDDDPVSADYGAYKIEADQNLRLETGDAVFSLEFAGTPFVDFATLPFAGHQT